MAKPSLSEKPSNTCHEHTEGGFLHPSQKVLSRIVLRFSHLKGYGVIIVLPIDMPKFHPAN
jgi:hypothetical protein